MAPGKRARDEPFAAFACTGEAQWQECQVAAWRHDQTKESRAYCR